MTVYVSPLRMMLPLTTEGSPPKKTQPEPMADDGYFLLAWLILAPRECASERGGRAEDIEIGRRDDGGAKRSRLTAKC